MLSGKTPPYAYACWAGFWPDVMVWEIPNGKGEG